jgi:O-antigen ligase
MRRILIEGGIYFLLIFAPFAFGGVEMWAQGSIQIVCGVVFVAWAWGRGRRGSDPDDFRPMAAGRRSRAPIWIPIGGFVLLVLFQLIPMPGGLLSLISPTTSELYSQTVPGYARGEAFEVADLPRWLLDSTGSDLEGVDWPASDGSAGAPLDEEFVATSGDSAGMPTDENAPLPSDEVVGASSGEDAGSPPPPPSGLGSPGLEDLLQPPISALGKSTRLSPARTLTVYPFQTRTSLTILLCYIGLFAVVVDYFRSRRRLYRLLRVAVISGFAVSLLGILQRLAASENLLWIRGTQHTDFFGPFVNRNSYAAFAGTILPVAICLCLSALRQWRGGREDAVPEIFFFGFASIVMAGGIFYCLSRGGMISAGVSVVVMVGLLLFFGRKGLELVILVILVVVAAGFLAWIGLEPVAERVGTLSEGLSTPTFASRVAAWRQTLGLIGDYPVFGTGLGTFRFSFLHYAPPGRSWWTTAHNEYIELICDTGFVGGAIFLLGFIAYFSRVLRPGNIRGRMTPYAYTGIVAGMAALLLHSAVSSNLQVPANGLLIVVLGASLLALVERQEEPGRKRAGGTRRRRVTEEGA